ncbi:cobalamin biosynthesis protein [Thiorhodococcus minor]|uniref:Cobalamin biosynthesis protein n=1 Tax=Thiorhodococcus minor TaxID=57489 RepID=A0A6M0K4W0_9GAMM|nr:cobalamin biosynthesis protein [Thiorhodococcus minor]NEV64469.1 cobalamin biosynthesis protein [Thiorhodococcus minor]
MTRAIPVCIGLGFQRGVALATLAAAIEAALAELGQVEVRCIASHQRKAEAPALLELARRRGWRLRFYAPEELAAVRVPNPSDSVAAAVGTPSVAEAAALLAAASPELLLKKQGHIGPDGKGVTIAVARCRGLGAAAEDQAPPEAGDSQAQGST